MRQVFKNKQFQAEFEQNGFVLLPFLSKKEAQALADAYDRLPEERQEGFFSGIFSENEAFKRESHAILIDLAERFSKQFLVDYRMLAGNFVRKMPGGGGLMPHHQDWTFLDERQFSSLNLWCALTDTNKDNGAMHLLRGSHRLGFNIRGTLLPSSFLNVGELTFDDFAYIPMKAGQILVHDHRVEHCSPPNITDKPRLATSIPLVPNEAETVHYFMNPISNRLEVYEAGQEFYIRYTYGQNKMPEGTKFLRYEDDYEPVQFSKEAVDRLKERQKKGFFQKLFS